MRDICRICLDSSEATQFIPIFSGNTNLDEKILIISGIRIIETNATPQVVCSECSDTIDNFLEFKSQIMRSDEYFQNNSFSVYKLNAHDEMIKEVHTAPFVEYNKDNEAAVVDSKINMDICASNSSFNITNETHNNCIEIVIDSSNKTDYKNSVKFISANESTLASVSFNNDYSTKASGSPLIHSDNLTLPRKKERRRTPSSRRKAPCNICGRILSNPSNLKMHLKIHSGERNFACDSCGKKYVNRCDVRKHIKRTKKCKVDF